MPSNIELCDVTINPFTGCDHGCHYCYARRIAHRLANIPGTVYHDIAQQGLDPYTPAWHADVYGDLFVHIERWRKPRRVFIGSMGDIGSCKFIVRGIDGEPEETSTSQVLRDINTLCEAAESSTFLVLTKLPQNLPLAPAYYATNLQMGVTVTGPGDYWRIDALRSRVPATTLRWVSYEPLLEPISQSASDWRGIDWIVVGAQTWPGAVMPAGVLTSARRLCFEGVSDGIPVFATRSLRRLDPDFAWPMQLPDKLEQPSKNRARIDRAMENRARIDRAMAAEVARDAATPAVWEDQDE